MRLYAFSQILRFESRVVLDGSQTLLGKEIRDDRFESRVILDGSQTRTALPCA